jgi:hypothetical protein
MPNPKQTGHAIPVSIHPPALPLSVVDSGALTSPPLVPQRRMTLRHDRRRRLLADESLSSPSDDDGEAPIRLAKEPRGEADESAAAYPPSARFDGQLCVHELIPARYLTIAPVVIVGIALVGLIELLHVWSDSLGQVIPSEDVLVLSLLGARNVSHWFASTLLVMASLVAMFIYSLRRHRSDDYRGRYRVWVWMAMGCLVASMAETTDVTVLAHGVCRRAAELCSISDAVAWPAAVGVALALIGVRLLIEVRKCRLAVAALAMVAVLFLLAAMVDGARLIEVSQANKPLVERGSWLVGYVFILAVFLLYSRHVVLEIEGPVAAAPSRPKRSKVKPAVPAASEKRASDPPHKPFGQVRTDLDGVEKAAAAPTRLQVNTPAAKPHVTPATAADDRANHGSLSRAERRRLRRDAKRAA